jgi:hypothetical protein
MSGSRYECLQIHGTLLPFLDKQQLAICPIKHDVKYAKQRASYEAMGVLSYVCLTEMRKAITSQDIYRIFCSSY